jgi:hypothetical protein
MEQRYGDVAYADRGAGWITFAAIMLCLVGVFSVIDGIVALTKSSFYTANAVYVFSDLRTWGWITLILGIVVLFAAGSVARGGQFGRWFGIIAAGVNSIGQLMFVPAYPWWSISAFAVDLLIIYALAAYGGRQVA